MIPYVISVAHPDYKRPYLNQDFGVVKEEEIDTYFLHKVCEFILDRSGDDDLNLQSINDFFDNYFEEYFMMNAPWSAIVFRNGEWENVTPSYEKIWQHIQLLKLQENEDKKEEVQKQKKQKEQNKKQKKQNKKQKKQEQDEEQEKLNLTEDDKETLKELTYFFGKMSTGLSLSSYAIEKFEKMNQYQQLTFLFNNITPEKFSENKEPFYKFINISIKIVQKDIEDITKKLKINHDDKLSEHLQQLMVVYSNAILFKQLFKF